MGALGCGSSDAATIAGTNGGGGGQVAASSSSSPDSSSSSAGSAGSGGAGGMGACALKHASFQKLLDDALPASNSPGAVLAIFTPDCGEWVGASGQSTKQQAMKPEYVLRIGSVTKTFVATTVLELVGEGALGLDDTLESWLPGFPNGANIRSAS